MPAQYLAQELSRSGLQFISMSATQKSEKATNGEKVRVDFSF